MNFKRWLLITVVVFIIGLLLGIIMPGGAGFITEQIIALEQLANILASLDKPLMAAFIFTKNVTALLFSLILSPVFLLVPLLALVLNGWIIGLIANTVVQEKSVVYLLAGLLPHGIFELPAFIIGQAVALSFGTAVLTALFKKERGRILANLKQNYKYLILSFVLLLPAAIIEVYITPLLLR